LNTVFGSINNQIIKISASLPITNVSIYDIYGRLVNSFKVNESLETSGPFYFASGVYIAKVKMNNGKIATVKLINN
jgi:hypothetical protein